MFEAGDLVLVSSKDGDWWTGETGFLRLVSSYCNYLFWIVSQVDGAQLNYCLGSANNYLYLKLEFPVGFAQRRGYGVSPREPVIFM